MGSRWAQCCMQHSHGLLWAAFDQRGTYEERTPFCYGAGFFLLSLCGYHSFFLQVEATNGKKFFRECSRRLFIARQSARQQNKQANPEERARVAER